MSLPALADSLAGRMELHTLWPFSQGELAGVRETFVERVFAERLVTPDTPTDTEKSLIDRLCAGGYPEIQTRRSDARRQAWFDSYVDAILQRDVRDLANIGRLSEIPRLLALLASRAGELLNFADLGRTLGIPQTTLKRYLALMETIFLVRLLPAWFSNLGKRLAKAPKLLVTDTGLLTHLIAGDRFVRGVVLCTGTSVVPFGRNLHALPVSQLWV